MPKFNVCITEISKRTVTVDANDKYDAQQQVTDAWESGNIILDYSDFLEMTTDAEEIE